MRRWTLLLLCLFVGIGLFAQTKVSGTVFSTEDGQPVIGAAVVVKGTTTGTVTDYDGKFQLESPAGSKTLIISFMGLTTQEVDVRPILTIRLAPHAEALDEVMVVAYGTAKKSSFTGSAETVKAEQIDRRVVASVSKAIEGTVAGVQSSSGSGQPGAGASIMVRGFGSINSSSEPLYVVDGAPFDGSISSINPSDIESITVLKDAASGALYGARGANGIVMITTKRGKNAKTNVGLKASWGVSSRAIKRYDVQDERGFLESTFQSFKNDYIYNKGYSVADAGTAAINAMKNSTGGVLGSNQQYNPYTKPFEQLMDPITGKISQDAQLRYSYNWMDEIEADAPLRQEYQINVSGGTDGTQYMTSFGYLNEEGLLKTTSFERITGRANIDSKISNVFKMGTSMNFALSKSNSNGAGGTSSSNVWYSAQSIGPIYPVYQLDGDNNIIQGADGKRAFDYGQNRPAGAQSNFNSIATLYDDAYRSKNDFFSNRSYAEAALNDDKYGFLKGIKLSTNIAFDLTNSSDMYYYNPYHGNAASQGGRLNKSTGRSLSYTWNQLLNWNRQFGKHSLDFLGGHEFYSVKSNYLQAQKTGFPFDGMFELASGSTIASATSFEDNYRIESWLSRLNYDYDNRYYLSASFRTDGSSRFHKDSRWGKFWSVGGSWRLKSESFLADVDWVNNLSARASYGVQGNDNLLGGGGAVYYGWQSFYDLGYPNASASGAMITSIENKNLLWEKNNNFNFGVDFRMFDRVSITAEYFSRVTEDMILYKPMATSLGFDGYYDNIGSMRNDGLDLSVAVNMMRKKDFVWNMNFLGSVVKNKVLKLVDGSDIVGNTTVIREGVALNSFYLPVGAGVDPTNGEKLYWVYDTDANGNRSERYMSSDPNKAVASRELAGNRIPKLYGSVSTDFVLFKDFDLAILTTYSIGGKILDGVYNGFMQPTYVGSNFHQNAARAWSQPGDITDIPKLMQGSNYRTTDQDLVSASYFSIKNITLGYTMPRKVASKIGIPVLRFFASADNIALFTHLNGMNPTSNFSGTTDYSYTPSRTVSFGFNANF